ncbi:MAG: hypothetical protein ACRDRH_18535 [Pseudonocardia sp.]
MTARTRLGRTTTLVLLAWLLAGCAADGVPAPADGAPAPAPPAAPVPPATPAPAPGTAAVQLPWPAADADADAALQVGVDGGAQPWLLDPAEVATSFATAAYGWRGTEASVRPDGVTVDVREAGGERASLIVSQPGRTGTGGVWVVTGVERAACTSRPGRPLRRPFR